jgi:hypothetical protein
MGNLAISIDDKPFCICTMDEAGIRRVLDEHPRHAANVGMSPEQFASVCIEHATSDTIRNTDNRVARETCLMGVTWRVLTLESTNPDHPGRIGDYADARVDIFVNLKRDASAGTVTAEITVNPKFDA